jgi:hypothetical protein
MWRDHLLIRVFPEIVQGQNFQKNKASSIFLPGHSPQTHVCLVADLTPT